MAAGSLRLAVAQPRTVVDPDAEVNVARAVELAARASDLGADLILFPEGYPGPVLGKPRDTYEAAEAMAAAAADHRISVCWSRMESCADGNYRLVVYAVDRGGRQLLRYERAHPATLPPDETRVWVAPGPDLALFEIGGVRTGIVVCSELWIPEPTRVLALRGAQVILSPAGGGFTSLTDNWQTIVRARAMENLCYVAMTNNIWRDEVGAAMIAGPGVRGGELGNGGTAPGQPRPGTGGVAQVERRLDGGAQRLLIHSRPTQGPPSRTLRGVGEAGSRPVRLPYPSPVAVTDRGILVRGGYVLTSSTPEMIEDGAVRIVGDLIDEVGTWTDLSDPSSGG